jgi:hypothetical protein
VAQLALVCFELTAINVIVEYWTDSLHPAICISVTLVALAIIQLYSVRWFGEIEFWISITKVLLMVGLTLYTFVTMVGGNPLKDKYGFRFWKTPGPFGVGTGLEVLRGVFDTVIWSCFAYVPPYPTRDGADDQCRWTRLHFDDVWRNQEPQTSPTTCLQLDNLPNYLLLPHWSPLCRYRLCFR